MPLSIIQKLEGLPRLYLCNQKTYNNLESIDPKGIYYIYDTRSIMTKGSCYNRAVVMYDNGARPIVGSVDKLYINSTTLEGYVFSKDTWTKVLDGLTNAEIATYDSSIESKKVNGIEAKIITEQLLSEIKRKTISSMTFDNETNRLIYRVGTVGHYAKIDGFISSFTFDPSTRIISLYNDEGTKIGDTKIMDNHIISGSYDDERKAIIFQMRDGTECRLKAQSILQIYKGLETDSAKITVENYVDAKNVIRGDIKVSSAEHNQLSINEDGLYSLSPKTTQADMNEGDIYVVKGEYVVPSTTNISSFATEAYVEQMKQDILDYLASCSTTHLKKVNVVDEVSETPSINNVLSAKGINNTFGLKRL